MPGDPRSDAAAVTLADLAAAVAMLSPRLVGSPVAVGDVHHDSRDVGPGECFVAIPGARVDGHDFAGGAAARGATALVVESAVDVDVPQLFVEDTRRALPLLAAAVHRHPSSEVAVVGVTGTNGKTTVTRMLESIVRSAELTPGVVGTVGALIGDRTVSVARTTPEASDLQRLLRHMVDAGVDIVALEVSSHALVMGRADAIRFEVAAFTNLSQDHLDFHGDMASYAAAKERLFEPAMARRAVVWRDDPEGARIAAQTVLPTTTVGLEPGADVEGTLLSSDSQGSSVLAATRHGTVTLRVPMAGEFNVANALVATACALELGIDLHAVSAGLEGLPPIPGRFEVVATGPPFLVVVDYAHTPAAIRSAIGAGRRLARGRVITVVGAGGDRDPEKRPAMGAAATTADLAVITSDNPRSEDPVGIIAAVVSGARGPTHVEPDRARAIEWAVAAARHGDAVLILGKGHEQGQEVGGEVLPFDDRVVAAAALRSVKGAP